MFDAIFIIKGGSKKYLPEELSLDKSCTDWALVHFVGFGQFFNK